MKSLLLAAALAGAAVSSTAFAYTPKSTPAAAPAPRVVPSSVVRPTGLPQSFADQVVNIEFSLDPAGQPHNIKVLWVDDPVLKKQLVTAFRQWRFESPAPEAAPAEKRFILPLQLRADS